ncbi:MAG: serine hydrolase domain-containing protein [Bacteroidota bacterium]
MKNQYFGILAFFLICVSFSLKAQNNSNHTFSQELNELKSYFHIPGLAAIIEKDEEVVFEKYIGLANVQDSISVTSNTAFPIASLTKIFSGVLLMKLVEEGKISLQAPINQYLEKSALSDSISIEHVLTHTSQGNPGQDFYYSYRFGALTSVIEKAFGKDFQDAISLVIFQSVQMDSSWFLTDSLEVSKSKLVFARPYLFDNDIQPGPVEYGVSASAGLVSTARDLLKFSKALDANSIISDSSKQLLFSPLKGGLPYGHGIFSQKLEGHQILWGYGQYDAYSSLFLKVPEKKITLILLANNNLMSDPARLIYGDITSSLFALSFLKNYVFDNNLSDDSNFQRNQLLAKALAASFMSRFDTSQWKRSVQLLDTTFTSYPNVLDYADLNLMHNLMFLKTVAFHKELGTFTKFDDKIEAIGRKLLKADPENPYANVYMGNFYDGKGDFEKARSHFQTIVEAKNFSPFWYTGVAKEWLKDNPK